MGDVVEKLEVADEVCKAAYQEIIDSAVEYKKEMINLAYCALKF